MIATSFHGRRARIIENAAMRVTVVEEGGHIAEIMDKISGVNPLWIPPWTSIEPSSYDVRKHPQYGGGSDSKLLAGIMGHNLCLDLFGGPSPEEAAAGITAHGEASVNRYEIAADGHRLTCSTSLPLAQLRFERVLTLIDRRVQIVETVENLSSTDRPIAWTQHVTLGPPFLECGITQFRVSATRSKVFESEFGTAAYLKTAADFDWPMAPRSTGGVANLQVFNSDPVSSAFTTHLMNAQRDDAFFVAFSPTHRLAFGYVWKRVDFPWLGIWEENRSRTNTPWNGATLTRGMEFGVSPMPESRREMIDRGQLFGVPAYRWLPAESRITAEYFATAWRADTIPETLEWPS
jgi:hypothetical protein